MYHDRDTAKAVWQDRTLFEKLMDCLKNLINDVKAAGKVLSERSQSWKQMGALKEDAATLQGLYDVMESIMQSEGEGKDSVASEKSLRKTVDKMTKKQYDSFGWVMAN